MAEYAISYEEGPRTLSVQPGDALRVRLPENPTTGYLWELERSEGGLLECADVTFLPHAGAAVGGGGIRSFHLVVRASGTEEVRFIKRRLWRKEDTPSETFHLRLESV